MIANRMSGDCLTVDGIRPAISDRKDDRAVSDFCTSVPMGERPTFAGRPKCAYGRRFRPVQHIALAHAPVGP